MTMTNLPSPPRIPVSGANDHDVEATAQHIELLTALFKSAVLENANLYRNAMCSALANHNENVPITRTARIKSFTVYFSGALEEFIAATSDMTGDVIGDVQRALEE